MTDGSFVIYTDYTGNYIYENGSLKMFFHPEGYFDVTDTPPSGELEGVYVYQYKDHLGNIRLSYSDSDGSGVISANAEIIEENNYYPFGLEHKGYNNVVNGAEYPYSYNGKEKQEELGLNWLDYGARNYDAALGRWMNIDNLAEQYKTFSPYHYAGNNPVLNYDVDGNEFTEAAWKWVNKLIADINSRQERNNEKIADKQAQLKEDGLSKGKIRRLNNQISRLQDNNTDLENVRGEIATLAASDQVDNVVEDSGGTERDMLGNSSTTNQTSFNFSNGNVDITISSGTDLGLFSHELKHAYQFEIGEISFGPKRPDFLFGIDKQDELEGYQRGALFGGKNITSTRDLGDSYDILPNGPYNSNNVKWIRQALNYSTAEEQQKRLKQVATSFRHAFRVNGKTYYKKKE
ncbi:RHS repeat domain-containing protein [Abyssalbus ytuae]|uniref:RHS repeat-associated core domain-containing protein n=1 Tax=Abyssalbus ytuae TaxID=2926907 RepID=A0A9E6ZIR2_9FLAO|nr:RHS repeat-associated core domain-containing protein [Abyssalbus ytuae]UOB16289.1 hypothetical protein MQE35_11125 [Abyssalbus ytuae]